MARYQVILAYDGTLFSGSQRQAKVRTIQGELESALGALGWSGRSVLMAGRTDAGVHAAGQVAAFDLEWGHSQMDLLRAINANLPRDMAVQEIGLADPKFHPRFDAHSRTYRYRLFCRPIRDPLREQFAWRVWPELSGKALRSAARVFIGRHDFAAFGSPPRPEGSTVRTVLKSSWQSRDDEWLYVVEADAFLYRMVRRLVYAQVAVAQGTLKVRTLAGALKASGTASLEGELPTGLAPAHGLTLVEVAY
jgi:tRNA pseudouridine38-40 synthase